MIAGRYTLVDEVGRGGMGIVWRGVDQVLDREVALKRIGMSPGGLTPDLARAEREARLAASLNHPNVVAVFDLVTEGDEQWLVMEYVENRTLAELVREQGPLSPDEAARLLEQAASALTAAHRAGIVHRDVKPSNILVTPDGRVKLSDFGIARAHADPALTQTGLMSGSPAYLSPEVASGATATAASDVWALGATLYHALTGRPPFEVGDNVMGALYQIVHADPPRPDNAGWLTPLLESTMTKDPEARWSMAQVRDFLARRRPTVPPPVADRGETTAVLAAAPVAAPTPPAEPVPEPETSKTHPSEPVETTRSGSKRWLAPLLLVGVLVLLVGLAFWALRPGDGERPTAATNDPDQASSAPADGGTPGPSPSDDGQPTDEPTEEPTPTETESPEASADEMAAFVEDYFSTVTSDPDTTWTWLTSEFQNASGGIDDYKGFWSGIDSVVVESTSPDPESMVVDYTATYTRTDGSVTTNNESVGLVKQGDRYLIASQS